MAMTDNYLSTQEKECLLIQGSMAKIGQKGSPENIKVQVHLQERLLPGCLTAWGFIFFP